MPVDKHDGVGAHGLKIRVRSVRFRPWAPSRTRIRILVRRLRALAEALDATGNTAQAAELRARLAEVGR